MANKIPFITFPTTPHKIREQHNKFYHIAQFPKVIGAIDGTHIYLHGAPLGQDEYLYTNRKGRYSINVQLICDADFRIINVVARWPGSTHDSRILQNSVVGQNYANGRLHGILLGDSGYALHPWLMTPILNPQNQAQRAYNQSHCRTRALIEQVNGQLKNKFRCLIGQGLQMRPDRASNFILACAVLHNISKQLRQPEVLFDVEANDDIVEQVDHAPNGVEARNVIIENHFS
ncbi:putative nuclease HARBI1 [Lytechinus pictus]|uniref:putative nuclease HARBI1 n=1 Tax=Lytechinus pictus TaxID=7653 RepID=UPI0030BA2556